MEKQEIFAIINANPVCHLATAEAGNIPHVRGVLIYSAGEDGIVFHTGTMKDLHHQLAGNPQVEMCFNNGDMSNLVQVRVSGRVVLDQDMDLKKKIVADRDFLKPWVAERGYDMLAVYRLKNGKAVVWTMGTNFAPKMYVEL